MPTETPFEELKRYVRFEPGDARLVVKLRPIVEPHFERIATEFYERIREHEGAHDVLTGEAQIRRLHHSLVRWMGRVFSGPYDEGYYQETATIGRVHVRIGLPQRYMLTAMAQIRASLLHIVDRDVGAPDRVRSLDALTRLLDLELAIMLQSYSEDSMAKVAHAARAEAALIADKLGGASYLNAVELARVMLIGLDAEGGIRLVNGEVERVSGYAREELLGCPIGLLSPDGATTILGLLRPPMDATTWPPRCDVRLTTKAGREREVEIAFARGGEGDEVVLFLSGRDVTAERAAARRGRQTEKLAAIGTLAAGLAHEIRNPLNGAMLHVTFLERTLGRSPATSPETLDAVRVVHEEIERLGTLVTEFLDFARPVPLDRKPTSVRALCERAVQVSIPPGGVSLDLELPTSDMVVALDGPKVQQVLLNLVGNALEAVAASGGGNVKVRAHRVPHAIVLEVRDTGPGLERPDAPIFDPFFSTKPGGTGLGLSIVHRIVTDHGGTIEVLREAEETVFRVRIPILSEDLEVVAR
jgi:PAS domain S-box-containing protein